MSFLKTEDLLYLSFVHLAVLASLIDRFFILDKYKAKYGACVGFLASIYLCGSEVIYPFLNISANAFIVLFGGKRAGILSFNFICCYLFYIRYFCSASPTTNLLMMSTTMKMMSVSMEYSAQKENRDERTSSSAFYSFSLDKIIYYSFHYIGIIGVPFYTFKTYCEYISLPFKHKQSEWKYRAIISLIDSILIAFSRYLLNNLFPLSCEFDGNFEKRSILYKIIYIYPLGFDFFLRICSAFVLGDTSCYITGLGAYPSFTSAKCGHGPTENIEKMYTLRKSTLNKNEFTYETVNNFNLMKMHFSIHIKDAIKSWNRTIQFWLYKYIYTTFPYNFLKKPATMLFSTYWHGLNLGNITSLFFSSFVLYLEELWEIKLRGRNLSILEKLLRIILNLHILYNLALSFICREWYSIVKYQNSVYWNYMIIIFVLFISSFFVKTRKLEL